jgi:2,4-dienoyl-CoA reductase-like NADH-dependent reductase (Old Yellow Enzyme family)
MKLFEPFTIKGMKVKNRIVMLPMLLGLGIRNPRVQAYYLEWAKGGAGSIVLAAISVDLFIDDEAWGRPGGAIKLIEGMKSFTEEIWRTGVKVGIQIWHGNRLPAGNGDENFATGELVAPSAKEDMRELSVSENTMGDPDVFQTIDGITNQLTCEGMTTYQTALDKLR